MHVRKLISREAGAHPTVCIFGTLTAVRVQQRQLPLGCCARWEATLHESSTNGSGTAALTFRGTSPFLRQPHPQAPSSARSLNIIAFVPRSRTVDDLGQGSPLMLGRCHSITPGEFPVARRRCRSGCPGDIPGYVPPPSPVLLACDREFIPHPDPHVRPPEASVARRPRGNSATEHETVKRLHSAERSEGTLVGPSTGAALVELQA
jgi:hypothetical protein